MPAQRVCLPDAVRVSMPALARRRPLLIAGQKDDHDAR
jgi:hypothetical protein